MSVGQLVYSVRVAPLFALGIRVLLASHMCFEVVSPFQFFFFFPLQFFAVEEGLVLILYVPDRIQP